MGQNKNDFLNFIDSHGTNISSWPVSMGDVDRQKIITSSEYQALVQAEEALKELIWPQEADDLFNKTLEKTKIYSKIQDRSIFIILKKNATLSLFLSMFFISGFYLGNSYKYSSTINNSYVQAFQGSSDLMIFHKLEEI